MTMPSPDGVARTVKPGLEDEVRQLRLELEALRQRPLRYAGEFFTENSQGHRTFFTGPNYTAPMVDGSPQWITVMRDANGAARYALWDPAPGVDGFVQAKFEWDHLGNVVFTTDNNGGWAEPHLPIILYPRITPPDLTAGNSWDFMWVSAASAGAEDTIWSGCIGYVSHSRIWVKGTWGGIDGGTGEYKLKINGLTVGTWITAGLETSTKGPFNLLTATSLMSREVDVDLTVRRSAGAGRIACQISHCHQRQT
jgi:hypothetical protein